MKANRDKIVVGDYLKHAYHQYNSMINCFSAAADYEYYIRIDDSNGYTIPEIVNICDMELSMYGAPDHYYTEDNDEYWYYFNAGYVEVVSDALKELGIEFTAFTIMED